MRACAPTDLESSGLGREGAQAEVGQLLRVDGGGRAGHGVDARLGLREGDDLADVLLAGEDGHQAVDAEGEAAVGRRAVRSEEHTSELQSLMRISYAVFCLNKKTTQPIN